jgi:hypothetical protein
LVILALASLLIEGELVGVWTFSQSFIAGLRLRGLPGISLQPLLRKRTGEIRDNTVIAD